jgi:hypothetical protein
MSSLVCAYCRKPLERLSSLESEVGEAVQERTEYMCTNTGCRFSSRIIYESKRPLHKQGYITVHMLNKREEPKSWIRKLFRERAQELSFHA